MYNGKFRGKTMADLGKQTQVKVLEAIRRHEYGVKVKELAEELKMHPSSVSVYVTNLWYQEKIVKIKKGVYRINDVLIEADKGPEVI